jgi:hypothetical protein
MAVTVLKGFLFYCQCRNSAFLLAIAVAAMCPLLALFNPLGPSQIPATITSEYKSELIYPRPDGSKDFNLIKDGTASFNGFSFYLMGDIPVSCPFHDSSFC